jgi:hypothetical protein
MECEALGRGIPFIFTAKIRQKTNNTFCVVFLFLGEILDKLMN